MAIQRYSNVSDVPLALAVFLAHDTYDHDETDDPHTISATALLKPLRQVIVTPRLTGAAAQINLSDMMANRLGQAFHKGFDVAWQEGHKRALEALGYPAKVIDQIIINPRPAQLLAFPEAIPIYLEQRSRRKIGKWTIIGKYDFVGEGRVQDFKTTSVWTWQSQANVAKYAQQGSIYRWLNPTIITQDQMDIIYVFLDWKAGMVVQDPTYPKQRYKKQSFDLMNLVETEIFIKRKIDLIDQYWEADEGDIPDCDDEELWRTAPVWKYYKNPASAGTGGRSTKNFNTHQEAMVRYIEDASVGFVKEVKGHVNACKYCSAFAGCSQKDRLIQDGSLVL